MTIEEFQEENKLLRKELLRMRKNCDECMKENKRYREMYWQNRARQDEGE